MIYNRISHNGLKSALHFDFPYYHEPYDGLLDDYRMFSPNPPQSWARFGNARLAGSQSPCDTIKTGTPYIGYRCLYTLSNSDYVQANTGWTLSPNQNWEMECFVRPDSANLGHIFCATRELNSAYTFSLEYSGALTLTIPAWGITQTLSSYTLPLSTWTQVTVKCSNYIVYVMAAGQNIFSAPISNTDSSNILHLEYFRIGGINGCIDEFSFHDGLGYSERVNKAIPAQYTLKVSQMGEWGNARHGASTITASCILNSYAMLTTSCSGRTLQVNNWSYGKIIPSAGDQIMLLVTAKRSNDEAYLGCYAFRTITALYGKYIAIDSEISDEFPLAECARNYYVQAIAVPQFSTLTINPGVSVNAKKYDTSTGGGIVVLRAKNSLNVNGSIISSGYGPSRSDSVQLQNRLLINRFIPNNGGGVFLIANNITCGNSARIGASWDGSLTGGVYALKSNGGNGGSGYGGAGGSDIDNSGTGGNGGVGGGGGGGDGAHGGNAGYTGSAILAGYVYGKAGTGGAGSGWGNNAVPSDGGTQGLSAGSMNSRNATVTGGAGAGGYSGRSTYDSNTPGALSGSNVVIIARNISIPTSAISTGGQGGSKGACTTGGGGTGFCYIACENFL